MSWDNVKIGDCCEITSSKRIFFSEYVEIGVPFYRSKEIIESANGQAISEPLFISQEKYDEIKENFGVPRPGDMLLTSVGTIGVPYIVKEGDYFYFKDGNLTWFRRFNGKLVPQYLYYWVRSAEGQGVLNNTTIGSSQKALTIASLKGLEIPCPPVDIQKRIAEILSKYDTLIENNQKQIKLLEEAAQRLYKEWFVDLRFPGHETTSIVDGVPEGWKKYKFSEIVAIMSGGTPKTDVEEYYDGDIPFYTPKDSDASFFAFDTITHISQSGLDHCNSQYYPVGTVIITARGTVGKTTILAVPMAMNQSCYALKCDELDSPYYLFFSLNKEVAALKTMANGGVFNTIIVKTFDSIHLTVPTRGILTAFDAVASPTMDKIKAKMQQNTILAEARDRLLPKLMSGEIEV